MSERLMILPASDFSRIRLVRVPEDISERDALRHATALIAGVQEAQPGCDWEDVEAALEDHGFISVPFELGPALD